MVSSKAATVADYLAELDTGRAAEIAAIRDLINSALPAGYREGMGWGMIGWVVPLERYPHTYNGQPLVYAALAAQKNSNSLYLNCVYVGGDREQSFRDAAAAEGKRLDMGKSCIRFRRAADLPLDAIRTEIASTTPDQFIARYEAARRKA